jgi:hypothetical protein
MRWMAGSVAAIATVGLGGTAAAQGDDGFLRGAGRLDLALSYGWEEFDEFWAGSDKVEDPAVGEVTRESLNLWLAYGLADELDVVATATWADAENDGTTHFHDERAPQDGTLGLKWRLFETRAGPGALSLLAAPAVKIPLSHYEANSVTALGDGQIDYRGRAIAHYQFDFGAYLAVESGFDYRTERPANEIPLHLSAGITLFDRFTLTPFWSLVDSEHGYDLGQGPFPGVEEDSERWGIRLFARIDQHSGITLGWKETIDGRNTGDLWGFFAGFVIGF